MKKKLTGLCFVLIVVSLCCLLWSFREKEKVALLFLTVNELNHPTVWQHQIQLNTPKFSVYVHSANPILHPFFSFYWIKEIVPTSWAIHARAWQELFREAVKDPNNKKFVLLSESCAPLKSLNEIYDDLIKDETSYMKFFHTWWPEDHYREVVELPKEHRWGNDEWVILNREQALMIAADEEVISKVILHGADGESYFSSLFSFNGILDNSHINNRI